MVLAGILLVAMSVGFAACAGGRAGEGQRVTRPSEAPPTSVSRPAEQTTAPSSDAGDAAKTVLVSGMRFLPEVVSIKPGESVLWHFNDPDVIHSVTAFDRSFDSGLKSAGSAFTVRFDTPGTYCYQCAPHPGRDLCAQGAVPDSGALLLSGAPLRALVEALNRAGGGGHMQGKIVVGK